MSLKKLLTDFNSFYEDYPLQQTYKTAAGPAYVAKTQDPQRQRNLPYGSDQPGGGKSKQPFIIKGIPGVEEDPSANFPDFLLRDPKNALDTRKNDTERILKFLKTPQGVSFIAKQELLSLQNPIVPGRPNRSNAVAGLYNPLMTLTQVAGAGTGLHIEKQGLYPIFNNNSKYDYVYRNNFNGEATNRLVILAKNKDVSPAIIISESSISTRNKLGIAESPQNILGYTGGPDSLGLGRTRIPFSSDRLSRSELSQRTKKALTDSRYKTKNTLTSTSKGIELVTLTGASQKSGELNYITIKTGVGESNDTNQLAQNSVYTLGNTFPTASKNNTTKLGVFTLDQIQLSKRESFRTEAKITDFRQEIISSNPDSKVPLYSFDYTSSKVNIETRVGIGNPGNRNRIRNRQELRDSSDPTKVNNDTIKYIDTINYQSLYTYPDQPSPHTKKISNTPGDDNARDLITFYFSVINNDAAGKATFIHFRAFLENVSDRYSATYDPKTYIGRGEKFYTYDKFDRTITLDFKVAPQSAWEMKPIHQKLNYLASTLAPDYGTGNSFMRGNLVKLWLGEYFYGVPGFITDLTYDIPSEYPWEINFDQPEGGVAGGQGNLLTSPMIWNVSLTFVPIHNFVPRLVPKNEQRQVAFITPDITYGQANPYLTGSIREEAVRIKSRN